MTIQNNYPAIKPTLNLDFANTKQLDPRITYSRASTGTYYDGKTVAKAEENLLTASQEFETGYWVQESITVTANSTVAPDGTTTANSLIEDSSNNSHMVRGASTANVGLTFTMSVFAKPNGRDFLHLSYNAGAGGYYAHATFNVSTGIVTASGAVGWSFVSAAITPASNGFYRCSLTFTPTTNAGASPCFCTSNTGTPALNSVGRPVYTGSGASALFIWGAQLEQRSFATAYTPTTTAPVTNYIPVLQTASAGTPRFDHNPITGESLGLLIEEQRTNLLLRSNAFTTSPWSIGGTPTLVANAVTAPDGTVSGWSLTTSANNILQSVAVTSGSEYTLSLYVKQGNTTFIGGEVAGAAAGMWSLNFSTLAVTVNNSISNGSVTNVGNGWYRVSMKITASATGSLTIFQYGSQNFGSTGTAYIWGAQLETGAFATSYIPTVASQVTRAADSASMTGTNFSSWYNPSEGTLYLDSVNQNGSRAIVGLGQGTFETNIAFNSVNLVRYAGGSTTLTLGTSVSAPVKLAAALKPGNFSASSNGALAVSDSTNIRVQYTANQLQIGASTGSSILNGTIKKLAYYNRRLTNTQLQALTS